MCMKAKHQRLKGNICILFITGLSKSRHFGNRHFGTVDILGEDILAQWTFQE